MSHLRPFCENLLIVYFALSSTIRPSYETMKFVRFLNVFVLLPVPTMAAVSIVMTLSPNAPYSPTRPTTQECTSLPPAHCCVPIDISESSPTRGRQSYEPTALDLRSTVDSAISIWANNDGRACDGPAVSTVEVKSTAGWEKYKPKPGVKLSGFAVDESEWMAQKEVLFPNIVGYKGGLYYEYMTKSLVYAKVSQAGKGPNIIYGFSQAGVGAGKWAFLSYLCAAELADYGEISNVEEWDYIFEWKLSYELTLADVFERRRDCNLRPSISDP